MRAPNASAHTEEPVDRALTWSSAPSSGVRMTGEGEPSSMSLWYGHRPVDTLGASTLLAASSIQIARPDDDLASTIVAVGASPLRAAAWLRTRRAAVGHGASKARLSSPEGQSYAIAARTLVSRSSTKTAVTLTEIRSSQIASWLAFDRVAITLVGSSWKTCHGNDVHALVVVAAAAGSLTVFDPAGDGSVEDLSFEEMDALRAEPSAAWEVLFATRR